MKILTRIGLWLLELQPAPASARRPTLSEEPVQEDHPLVVSGEPHGACGWFDSSHALINGLRVQEIDKPESLAELPLRSWLELELGATAPVRPDGRPGSPARPG